MRILKTLSPLDRHELLGHAVTCPNCGAVPGSDCFPGGKNYTHRARLDKVSRIRGRITQASRSADSQR